MSNPVTASRPSLTALLVAFVDQPKKTLWTVLGWRDATVWLIPLLLILLSSVSLAIVQAPYNRELARQQLQRQLQQLPEEQRKETAAQMEAFTTTPVLVAGVLLGGFFALLVGLAGQALWLYLGASIVGGDVSFGTMWRLGVWSRLPYALGWSAQAGFTVVSGRVVRYPGLSALVATGDLVQDSRSPLFALLGSLDLFWFWHVLLVAVGLSAARLRRGPLIALTLSYAVLGLTVQIVPAMFFRSG
ncbi:MAG: YIP1 family protein [Anaerolineae bacterium]